MLHGPIILSVTSLVPYNGGSRYHGSPAEWCKMQDGVCIFSYKHDILHKGAFGCALSYLSKRKLSFPNMAAKSKMAAINRFKDKKL